MDEITINSGLWRREFSEEYAVPESITAKLYDLSWHNDCGPSFSMLYPTDMVPTLFVEHPDPKIREGFDTRYCVTVDGDDLLTTDDVDDALRCLEFYSAHYGHDVADSAQADTFAHCRTCGVSLSGNFGRDK